MEKRYINFYVKTFLGNSMTKWKDFSSAVFYPLGIPRTKVMFTLMLLHKRTFKNKKNKFQRSLSFMRMCNHVNLNITFVR